MIFARFFIFIFLSFYAVMGIAADTVTVPQKNNKCLAGLEKKNLTIGWFLWNPYQFKEEIASGYQLSGMDVEIVKKLAERVGVEIKYENVEWKQQQIDLKNGIRDFASGGTYTSERAEYVYYSEPYRFEENSLFVLRDSDKNIDFKTISEFLAQVRLQNFKLATTKGVMYADLQINLFLDDNANRDIIYEYNNDIEAFNALIRGEIDGFIADRIVGGAVVLNHEKRSLIREVNLKVKTPIHFMFSKKAVPIDLVDRFNQEIKSFSDSDEYKDIVKTYLYPVMLLQTIESGWFYLIGVIGTFAFAISGIAIAAKDNTTFFGTFLFAMLPSVGGGIIRDVLTNREPVGLFLTPSYMYYIIITVLIGFSAVRILEYYNTKANEDDMIMKFWDNILIVGDAIGQGAFVVTGVSIVIMARIEPIALWGPFFAFLSANGGSILRDLLRKKHYISCLDGGINAEVAVLWGLIFSLYLDFNSHDPDPTEIQKMVVLIVVGAVATRLIVHYFNIPNIKFRVESKKRKQN